MFFKKQHTFNNKELIKASLYGFFIGDALGVPVEFVPRANLKNNPIIDMEGFGTHYQPKGTWSDDSSMVLATIDGLLKGNMDYQLIMDNFLNWKQKGEYTPFHQIFDIGNSTSAALSAYHNNKLQNHPEKIACGSDSIHANGNGSLMRILPISFYLFYSNIDYTQPKFLEIIQTISSMTHSHSYSIYGCYIYSIFVFELLKGIDKYQAYKNMQEICKEYIKSDDVKSVYSKILFENISKEKEKNIKSSGYVVDSLEACIWSVLTSNSFEKAVLKAVNLGDDTDTIGALTGALAGLIFGYDAIPKKWITSLQRKDYLEQMISDYETYLNNLNSISKKGEIEKMKKIDLNMLEETIKDLKTNPNACTTMGGTTSEDGVYTIPESNPGEQLSQFMKYLYENDLMDYQYVENYEKIKDKDIEDYTYEEALTAITTIIRSDRFVSCNLYQAVKEGTLLKILQRLKDLSKE